MVFNEEVASVMDSAAVKAEQELRSELKAMSAIDVAIWVQKWFATAGYKRLCQILKQIAKENR
jgi:hypothetical protein